MRCISAAKAIFTGGIGPPSHDSRSNEAMSYQLITLVTASGIPPPDAASAGLTTAKAPALAVADPRQRAAATR